MKLLLALTLAAALGGASGGPAASPPPGDAIRVRGVAGDTVVNLLPSGGGGRVRLDVMARLLGGRLDSIGPARWRLTLSEAGIELQEGMPFAAYNGFALPLVESVIVADGAPHAPLQLFSEIIPRFGVGVLWDRTRWELRLFQSIARQVPAPSGTTSRPATPVAPTANTTPAAVPQAPRDTPPAAPAVAAPSPGAASPAPAATTPSPAAPVVTSRPAVPSPDAPPGLLRKYVVAVDAGHGGRDPGNPGVVLNGRRVNEALLTLAMAKRLESELRSRGLEVVMTRDEDRLVPLEQRGPIANGRRADLFISLHTNAANPNWRNGSAVRGVETYFLATARTEDERRVAEMENEVVRFEVETSPDAGDPLGFILNDIAQNEHLRESADLAQLVQGALAAKHPGPSRGVKQAGFMVLSKAFMPAVLVEVGFGTNVDDARWMASVAGQREIAESISDAVFEYLRHYERRTRTAGR
ncbi:MAG: N-acetylmuramoyl-L-alanine amidase [Gemmatimonadaceae bacterium]|nr:N-acetylmuramoyl-L-alanine amidase [Gemmatimonadaceae bacterium]MCW5825493.1 N-acetylmuramoyl-L-alanine amidase [Gemmatimonadaceae bacterium]